MIGVHYANFCLLSKTLKLKSEKIYNYIQKVGTRKEGTTTTTITTTASTAALLIDIICTQEGMKYEF